MKNSTSNQVKIPIINKGELRACGYVTLNSDKSRHIALSKAVKKYGKISVIHKLNAIKILTKNSFPIRSSVYEHDMEYVQCKL